MHNLLKTTLYLAVLTGLMLFAGQLIGGTNGLIIAFIFAGLMNFISYFFSDKIVLALYHAKEVSAQQEPELHEIVSELSRKAKIPKPKVYILPAMIMNAFATGRNPKNAAIAVTPLIMQKLSKDELRAVLGHELTHVKNRDTLISTMAATIAGAVSMIANMAWYSGFLFGARDDDNSIGNALSFMILIILTPIIALLIRLAISRVREYSADMGAAKLVSPKAMISALEALEFGPKIRSHGSQSTAHLFIVNPFSGQAFAEAFSTHPPIIKRIERLREEFDV